MTTVNPSAELQPKTSASPSGPPKSARSFSLQVTLVTQMMPVRMTVKPTPTLSHRDARPSDQAQSQIRSSLRMLQGQKKAEPFRNLRLPDVNWLKPELMKGKTYEDSELRANAAGMCGLAALTCAETSHTHASRIHATCKTLPPLPNASQEELNALKAWRDDIHQEVTDWVAHIKIGCGR
jgi:hypothetical protein